MKKKYLTKLKQFLRGEHGGFMIMLALMLPALVLSTALPVDLGRGYMASSAIQGASDAAAVASAVEGGSDAQAEAYFKANLQNGRLGIGYDYATDVTHTVDTAANSVTVQTTGFDVPSFFSRGTTTSAAGAGGSVGVGGVVRVGMAGSAFQPADYYFIIDSSGSMSEPSGSGNTKSQAVGVAINNFLQIVFANQGVGANGISNYRVSLTNYSSSYALTHPLEDDQAIIMAQLAPMLNPGGATCGGCGMRDSKERFIGEAQSSTTLGRKQVFIFLTDGMQNSWDNSYMNLPAPAGYNGGTFGNSKAHEMVARECYSIKNIENFPHTTRFNGSQSVSDPQDETIWTVRFGNGANGGTNLDLMNYCASDISQSIWAQTGNDLDQAFTQIGLTTGRVRITQ